MRLYLGSSSVIVSSSGSSCSGKHGAKARVHLVKCLLCKQDLSSYPSTQVKKEDVVACVYTPNTPVAAGRQRQKTPGSSQVRYPSIHNSKQETLS